MGKIVKLSLILLTITIISAALLGVTNDITSVIIQEKAIEANLVYMKDIIPDADEFAVVEGLSLEDNDSVEEVYEALKSGDSIAYIIKTVTTGYGGDVVQLVGIDHNETIVGIKVVSQSETPGLGDRIAGEDFTNGFIGKSATNQLEVVKGAGGDNSIESLSGATVSSEAAVKGVNEAIKLYVEVLK